MRIKTNGFQSRNLGNDYCFILNKEFALKATTYIDSVCRERLFNVFAIVQIHVSLLLLKRLRILDNINF